MKHAIAFVFLALAATHVIAKTTCLEYEPKQVGINGTLVEETHPGPPNFESIARGDKPQKIFVVKLPAPICVNGDDDDLNTAEANIQSIQLALDPKQYKTFRPLLGRPVVATGTLFHSITGYHFTTVLMTATDLRLDPTAKAGAPLQDGQPQKDPLAELRNRAAGRLFFHSAAAESIVRNFNLDCRHRDGRYLPLINLLYAQIDVMRGDRYLVIDVMNKGDEVRIFHTVRDKNGPLANPSLIFDINGWGEMHLHGVTPEAILRLCGETRPPRLWVPRS